MALSLDQISTTKNVAPKAKAMPEKKQLVRPWQSFETVEMAPKILAPTIQKRKEVFTHTYKPRRRVVTTPILEPQEIKTSIKAGGLIDLLNLIF